MVDCFVMGDDGRVVVHALHLTDGWATDCRVVQSPQKPTQHPEDSTEQ